MNKNMWIIGGLILLALFILPNLGTQAVVNEGITAKIIKSDMNPSDRARIRVEMDRNTADRLFRGSGAIIEFCADCYDSKNIQALTYQTVKLPPGGNCDRILTNSFDTYGEGTTDKATNAYFYFGSNLKYATYFFPLTGIGAVADIFSKETTGYQFELSLLPDVLEEGEHNIYVTIYKLTEKPEDISMLDKLAGTGIDITSEKSEDLFRQACLITRDGYYNTYAFSGTKIGTITVHNEIPRTGGLPGTDIIGLSEAAKISLTPKKIKEATSTQLIQSACLDDDECIKQEDYDVFCISLASLQEKGILSTDRTDGLFNKAGTYIKSGVTGATIGALSGIGVCAFLGGVSVALPATAPVLIASAVGTCSAASTGVAALIGTGVALTGTNIALSLDSKDPLVQKLNAKDTSEVGICTATQSGFGIFKSLAFFDVDGNGYKDGTDGMIILVGIILLLFMMFMVMAK